MKGTLYRYPHPQDPTRFIYVGQGPKRDNEHRSGRSSFGRRFKVDFLGAELPQPIREQIEVSNQLELNEEETIWMFRFHTWRGYFGGMNLTLPGLQDYKQITALAGAASVKSGKGIFAVNYDKGKGGRAGGKIAGRIAVKSGRIKTLATPESLRKGGQIQGRNNVENGHIVKIHSLPQSKKAYSENGLRNGPIQGRKNVQSGQLDQIRNLPQTKLAQSAVGKINGRRNVESGQVIELGRKNVESGHIQALGRKYGRKYGREAVESGKGIFAPNYDRGKGGRIANCLRWNIRRNKPCICGKH